VLDVGRRLRPGGWRLREGLEARDGGCRCPGCGCRLRTHAHRVVPWAKGGETAMNNLVLLCPLHHRAVHEGGWSVEMDDGGVLRFLNPLGVEMPLAPEAPDIGGLLPGGGGAARDGLAPPTPAANRSAAADAPAAAPADESPPRPQDLGLAHWHGRPAIEVWPGRTVRHGQRIETARALDWFCNQPGAGKGAGAGRKEGGKQARPGNGACR